MRVLTIFFIFLLILPVFYARASADPEVDALHRQAYELFGTDMGSAMTVADRSLELAEKAGYQWGIANSYYIKGHIHRKHNDLTKALLMYLKASAILENLADERSVKTYTDVLLNSGSIFRKYYKYDEAIEFYDKGLELATAWDFPGRRSKFLYNKASNLHDKGDLSDALEALKQATQLADRLGDNARLIKCFNLFGLIHTDNEFYDAAREYYQYILSDPNATDKDKAMSLHNLALTYYEENKPEVARMYFERALKLKRQLNNPQFLFNTLHGLAEWHFKKNDLQKAGSYAMECEKLFPSLVGEPETFEIFHLLGAVHIDLNDLEKVRFYFNRYREESLAFHAKVQEVMRAKARFEMDLILAGFHLEQKALEQQAADRKIMTGLGIAIAVSLIIALVIYVRQRLFKRGLKKIVVDYIDNMNDHPL